MQKIVLNRCMSARVRCALRLRYSEKRRSERRFSGDALGRVPDSSLFQTCGQSARMLCAALPHEPSLYLHEYSAHVFARRYPTFPMKNSHCQRRKTNMKMYQPANSVNLAPICLLIYDIVRVIFMSVYVPF